MFQPVTKLGCYSFPFFLFYFLKGPRFFGWGSELREKSTGAGGPRDLRRARSPSTLHLPSSEEEKSVQVRRRQQQPDSRDTENRIYSASQGQFSRCTHRAQPARRPGDAGGYLLTRGETTRPNRAFNATRWTTYRAAGPPSRNGPPARARHELLGVRRKCGDDDGRLLQAGDVFSGFSPKYPLVSTQDLFWFRGDNEKSPRLRRCQSSCRVSKGLQ